MNLLQNNLSNSWGIIIHNNNIIERKESWQLSPKEFLLHYNNGCYSCTRTVNYKIFNWELHVNRLVMGTFKVQKTNIDDSFINSEDYINTYSLIENIFKENIKISIENYKKTFKNGEMRIYMLLVTPKLTIEHMNKSQLNEYCWIYVQQLPNINRKGVPVIVKKYERENPEVKSLEWMRNKKQFEELLDNKYEECLLAGGNNNNYIYEGLSSNFFIVKEGNIYCAPKGTILFGTIMNVVIKACNYLNINIFYNTPCLDNYNTWDGCFITSTTRLVLPISTIIFLDHNKEQIYFKDNKIIKEIQDYVKEELDKQSTDITQI